MAALIISPQGRARIAELKAFAMSTPPQDPRAVMKLAARALGDFRDAQKTMTVYLPVGYAVTYTREIQPEAPGDGLCDHISVSIDRRGRMPSPEAVEVILQEFGMRPIGESEAVWTEDIGPGEKAVNIVQLVNVSRE